MADTTVAFPLYGVSSGATVPIKAVDLGGGVYALSTSGTSSVTYPITPDKGGTGVANNASSTLTISGNFGTTFTVSGTTALTLPTSGTLATVSGVPAAISGQPINPSSIGPDTGLITQAASVGQKWKPFAGQPDGFYLLGGPGLGAYFANGVYFKDAAGSATYAIIDSNGINLLGRVVLASDAANTLALRNGTNGQTFVISCTYTDPGNYSQLAIIVGGSTGAITTQEAGTGVGTITGITIDRPLTAGANAIKGLLTTNANATTGLIAGALAALTNASVVIYDGSGTAYRVPCVTP